MLVTLEQAAGPDANGSELTERKPNGRWKYRPVDVRSGTSANSPPISVLATVEGVQIPMSSDPGNAPPLGRSRKGGHPGRVAARWTNHRHQRRHDQQYKKMLDDWLLGTETRLRRKFNL